MALVADTSRATRVPVPGTGVDEAAARRALRTQIARLERQLGDAFVSAFPRTPVDVRVGGADGPRVLALGELEAQRDALAERLRQTRAVLEARGAEVEANRVLLERMLANPRRYKFARLQRADVELGGCGAYQVRPRLGIIGMLMGWWQVKLSSGCPLAWARYGPSQSPA
jgi:hypothetical protein